MVMASVDFALLSGGMLQCSVEEEEEEGVDSPFKLLSAEHC